jgi:hypothetical protein
VRDEDKIQYEVYREKYVVTEWRDGCVYKTLSVETGWFDLEETEHPPFGVSYAAASDEFAENNSTIRKKRG